jgi:hypothetical protein
MVSLQYSKHTVQGHESLAGNFRVDVDLVNDLAARQMLERPEDVGGVD